MADTSFRLCERPGGFARMLEGSAHAAATAAAHELDALDVSQALGAETDAEIGTTV